MTWNVSAMANRKNGRPIETRPTLLQRKQKLYLMKEDLRLRSQQCDERQRRFHGLHLRLKCDDTNTTGQTTKNPSIHGKALVVTPDKKKALSNAPSSQCLDLEESTIASFEHSVPTPTKPHKETAFDHNTEGTKQESNAATSSLGQEADIMHILPTDIPLTQFTNSSSLTLSQLSDQSN